MVQPYLEELVRKGEWSLVFLGGRFSHAVLKRPAPGDFRVQKEFGGRLVPAEPTSQAIEEAQAILAAAPKPHLYARVDAVEIEGRLVLVELEMIEPELFFWADPAAPLRFVEALEALDGSRS